MVNEYGYYRSSEGNSKQVQGQKIRPCFVPPSVEHAAAMILLLALVISPVCFLHRYLSTIQVTFWALSVLDKLALSRICSWNVLSA